jgi:hypothetical protein
MRLGVGVHDLQEERATLVHVHPHPEGVRGLWRDLPTLEEVGDVLVGDHGASQKMWKRATILRHRLARGQGYGKKS